MSLHFSLPARLQGILEGVLKACRRKRKPAQAQTASASATALPPQRPVKAANPNLIWRRSLAERPARRTPQIELQEASASLYLALGAAEQAVVRDYFAAAHEVSKLLLSIRLYGKVFSCEALLGRFEKLELHYHGLGLLPVLPSAVDWQSAADINRVIERGLIQARLSLNVGANGCGKATYESITGGDGSNPARPTASTAGITRGITTYSAGIRRHVHNLDRQFRLKESATVQGHARH
ncbi:MAG TPA: hypothetical protein PLC15_04215 [Candidatus Obscuribacter sp.]|nr:hypothetical protein [Candidatus Obscuribacter sp.]HNB14555.1 hypothetical protein [Candidatus Obscuribacter sp.]HND67147.1 hypothetical protein [Candidatus Obscuribacter sp.]HNG72975.1 hypothetical protein [Candidatus Obscuribacter sp.]HNH74400.1 hypothetical protein [Candidatus Obscuribacter sp.]